MEYKVSPNHYLIKLEQIHAVAQWQLAASQADTFTSSLIPSEISNVITKIIYTDLWVLILEPSSPQARLSEPGLPVHGPCSETDPLTHPLSFPFPRNATRFTSMTWRQTTTDRIWGNAALAPRLTDRPTARSAATSEPDLPSVGGGDVNGEGGWRACSRLCEHKQACACLLHFLAHIICHRINQLFQFSSKISLYRSPCLPPSRLFIA